VSAAEERDALTPRPPLYAYALHLHREGADGSLPRGWEPLPREARGGGGLNRSDARVAVTEILTPLVVDPRTAEAAEEVHRALAEQGVGGQVIASAVAEVPLPDEAAARALGRRLTRTGTSFAAVRVGLGLLARLGGQEDVPCLKMLGLLPGLARPAVQALAALDCPTAALVWLAGAVKRGDVRHFVDALIARGDPAARACLLRLSIEPGAVDSTVARRIAEAVRLADQLVRHPGDDLVVLQAARLLATMCSTRNYAAEMLSYQDAVAVYEAVVAGAARLPATLDGHATLLSLALDLHSGPSVLLDWGPGQREALLAAVGSLLRTPAWSDAAAAERGDPQGVVARRRADWIRRTGRRPFTAAAAESRLRVEVVAGDPAVPGTVETRLLVDGRPLVAEAFGRGPAHTPEYLLDSGRLRATAEPREVQLAEAYCTEGCCGAIYVTICREGEQVVWRDWRRPNAPRGHPPLPELPEYRFESAAYDAEIARAETDRSWAWPARDTARLVAARLRADPGLLERWDARLGSVGTAFADEDAIVLTFMFWPGLSAGHQDRNGPWLQFAWRTPKDASPPEEQAAAMLRRLAEEDPKTYAEVCGGSPAYAEALGYQWPDR
jgi:hypothetical protein